MSYRVPDECAELMEENRLMRADLQRIGEALGIPALPYSGHEAVERDFLRRIDHLKAASQTTRAQQAQKGRETMIENQAPNATDRCQTEKVQPARHPMEIAWESFLASPEGQRQVGFMSDQHAEALHRRKREAFEAGWQAAVWAVRYGVHRTRMSDPVRVEMMTPEERNRLQTDLTTARLAVNDFYAAPTQGDLERWRMAQDRLIHAASALGAADADLRWWANHQHADEAIDRRNQQLSEMEARASRILEALHESQSRFQPDANYETYLDNLSRSLVEVLNDRASEGDEFAAAAVQQSLEALNLLRRVRDELRTNLNRVALAATEGR